VITEMSLNEFCKWLPKLQKKKIHIGVNWSGERQIGYDVEPQALVKAIKHCKLKAHA